MQNFFFHTYIFASLKLSINDYHIEKKEIYHLLVVYHQYFHSQFPNRMVLLDLRYA